VDREAGRIFMRAARTGASDLNRFGLDMNHVYKRSVRNERTLTASKSEMVLIC